MIRELKTFVAVCELDSFAAAARHINLTQSAVSAQIKTLEDNLGVSLFTRSARAITLNPQGTRILPIAKEILALYATMQLPSDTDIASYYGQLRIGAINSVQVGILPEALKAITLLAPLMQTEIVPGRAVELFDTLEVGEIDAAITIQPSFALPKDIVTQSIMTEPYVLISPKKWAFHSVKQTLEQHPFIHYSLQSSAGAKLSKFFKQQDIKVNTIMEINDLDAIVRMVESGLGVALIPYAGLWIRSAAPVQVHHLGDNSLMREVVLAYRYADRQKPQITALKQVLGL
ncbi:MULTISPECIES: LysR substrate-binding domain-containing protein [unclassified Psychrobacter]|uniref:LysR substrate-binding domain-containing protein n=1 Tax=unclassified Psychrobacter TaxID=196806 RepID=UPI0018F509CD|nr:MULTISPECIES: LysR substrate-binding domain-containing protein [unclassified Psychrobacter]